MADEKSTEIVKAKTPDKKPVKQKSSKPSVKGLGNYFKTVYAEIKKIVWPSRKSVLNNTIVVIVAIIVVGAFIWGIDALFSWPIGLIKNYK